MENGQELDTQGNEGADFQLRENHICKDSAMCAFENRKRVTYSENPERGAGGGWTLSKAGM